MNRSWQLIVHEDAKSPIAEAYRTLRTNLHFCKADGELGTIMFTSAGPGEGKSLTVANTAVALANNGKKVIIVDCDLRKPVQHKVFNARRNSGVTNILINSDMEPEMLIQETAVPNLSLLASGPLPPNPSEILSSERMTALAEHLRDLYDYVIFDAPPVIAVTDACVLASKVDGVVMVLGTDTVRPEMARKAKELIVKAKGHVLGVVLNRIEIEAEHSYYYYYYGSESAASRK